MYHGLFQLVSYCWMFELFSILLLQISATKNCLVYMSFHAFPGGSLGKIPQSGVAGSKHKYYVILLDMDKFLSPGLYSHQQSMGVPIFPQPCQQNAIVTLLDFCQFDR